MNITYQCVHTAKIPDKEIIYSFVNIILGKIPSITTSDDSDKYRKFIKGLPRTSNDDMILTRNDL